MLKRFLKGFLIIVIVFALIVGGGIIYMTRGLSDGTQVTVHPIDLSGVADGSYSGRYEAGRWTNELQVTVRDHQITAIDVIKDVTFSQEEVREAVIKGVIDRQNTDIDVISSATVTSRAYLKAVEDAFR